MKRLNWLFAMLFLVAAPLSAQNIVDILRETQNPLYPQGWVFVQEPAPRWSVPAGALALVIRGEDVQWIGNDIKFCRGCESFAEANRFRLGVDYPGRATNGVWTKGDTIAPAFVRRIFAIDSRISDVRVVFGEIAVTWNGTYRQLRPADQIADVIVVIRDEFTPGTKTVYLDYEGPFRK